ncbi:AAA family ATPase [Kibdelosporangium philippinense]|uniref:AAA family ATPase n=1 Tax=Kibdelosporangium philippinense TaxID=211113 RepID=A0ABS8ZRE3_9PSEU|nr:LuxR family transcriptional regulator [Kibdelosporangium philippinense]MCE7010280.1 AAA family ATPase [Kibdelosporangium philippinense]
MGALIGREREKKTLSEFVDGVRDHGGAMIVRGEAGIGKSALVAEVTALTANMRVLKTTGADSEQHLPFAGLHQLLHPVQREMDTLPAAQRDALSAALGLADTQAPNIYLVGLATLNLLADLAASKPLLLIAEDVHSLDPSSVDVLAFVARRLESEPIVLIATVRSGECTRLDEAGLPSMMLERLPDDAAADLLDIVAPDLTAPVRARLLAQAAGNPLALTELPRSGMSVRLEEAFTARVAGLPDETRETLLIAALNDSGSLKETLDAAAVDISVLTPAVEARLIEIDYGTLTFRHPLMRSAIPQAADLGQRQAAHRALAEVLDRQPERRAWHRATASTGPDDAVAADLEAAAEHALRRGDVAGAVTTFELSGQLSENALQRAERLLQAAELAVESGRKDVVVRLLRDIGELTAEQQARATLILSDFEDGLRSTTGPMELAELAESVAADGRTDLGSRILWSGAMRCFWVEPGPTARQRVMSAADCLLPDDLDPRKVAITAYISPFSRGEAVDAGLRHLAGHTGGDPLVERFLGSAAMQFGAFKESARLSASAASGLRAQGRLGLLTRALAVHAWSSVRLGNVATALPAAVEAGRLAQETDQPFMRGLSLAVQAEIAALRGDCQAQAVAAEAEQIGLAVGARPVLATVQIARGIAALGQGRYADAFADLQRLHDPADPAYQLALRCYTLPELADAAVRTGQPLDSVLSEMEEYGRSAGSPALHIGLRYANAVLTQQEDAYVAALNADLSGWPLERARIQLAFGEWLRRHRRAAESRAHLRAARETFDALGVLAWSERARGELRAAGEASPRRSPDARDQLTAQELSIAQLAAKGLTNREIGHRLYLSHRTVSTHLHRIFPKLGISSRAELGAALKSA